MTPNKHFPTIKHPPVKSKLKASDVRKAIYAVRAARGAQGRPEPVLR
jgi:hypothetical protein